MFYPKNRIFVLCNCGGFFYINRVTKWLINHIRIQLYLSLSNDSPDTTFGPVITTWRDFKFPYSKDIVWKFSSSYLSLLWGVYISAKYVANTFDTLSWVFAVIPPCTISGYIPYCWCLCLLTSFQKRRASQPAALSRENHELLMFTL